MCKVESLNSCDDLDLPLIEKLVHAKRRLTASCQLIKSPADKKTVDYALVESITKV